MTDRRRAPAAGERSPVTGTFILELLLDDQGPVCGAVRAHPAEDGEVFTGWVELMLAVERLRSTPIGGVDEQRH